MDFKKTTYSIQDTQSITERNVKKMDERRIESLEKRLDNILQASQNTTNAIFQLQAQLKYLVTRSELLEELKKQHKECEFYFAPHPDRSGLRNMHSLSPRKKVDWPFFIKAFGYFMLGIGSLLLVIYTLIKNII